MGGILGVVVALALDPEGGASAPVPLPTPPPAPDGAAVPAPDPVGMESPPSAAPSAEGAYTPPVVHITTDPLLPQRYRTVPAGRYPCSVVIQVSAQGKATDVRPVDCEQEAMWALAAAVLQWEFEPATRGGVPVEAELPYTAVFEVSSWLPRKHIVGFVGLATSVGGTGVAGLEGRIHLGEILSFSGGVDLDQDLYEGSLARGWNPVFRADATLSSRRRHNEKRGIAGLTLGGFGDPLGSSGAYAAARAEAMLPVPGLSVGGDAGLATLFTPSPKVYDDVGIWPRTGPVLPWLRASLIWYAPIPKDRFVVVPRADDPVVYEPIIPVPEPLEDMDGSAFEGVPAYHWSDIEPSYGENTPTGPAFANYPPGTYLCNVRALVGEDGRAKRARAERCPEGARADAVANVMRWEWPPQPGRGDVQAVFPAPVFVRRDDAELVKVHSVLRLEGDQTFPIGARTPMSDVYVHAIVRPEWGAVKPTRECYVDVDLDATGAVLRTRWAGGDIEVQPAVMRALGAWRFYPVAVDGELTPVRVRVAMCNL